MGGDGVGLISPRGRPPPPAASRPPGRPQGKRKPPARKLITQDAAYTSTSGRLATSGRGPPGICPQGPPADAWTRCRPTSRRGLYPQSRTCGRKARTSAGRIDFISTRESRGRCTSRGRPFILVLITIRLDALHKRKRPAASCTDTSTSRPPGRVYKPI